MSVIGSDAHCPFVILLASFPDWWHVVTVVNASAVTIAATVPGTACGIVGNLWGMVAGWNPAQQSYIPKQWDGIGGCEGECRVKNLGIVDSSSVGETREKTADSSTD